MMKPTCKQIKCKSAMMLVFGVLFFLGTLGVWPEFTFVKYWPLLLIVGGLHGLFCRCMQSCDTDMHKK